MRRSFNLKFSKWMSTQSNTNNSNNTNSNLPNGNNNNKRRQIFLNIISVIFLIGLTYYYFSDKSINLIMAMIIAFSVSFVISYFILNKFIFSKNVIIRFIQKTILFAVLYILIVILLNKFGIIDPIYCMANKGDVSHFIQNKDSYEVRVVIEGNLPKKPVDAIVETAGLLLGQAIDGFGAAGAGGTAASAMVKGTVGLPGFTRLALIGGAGFITSSGVLFGLKTARALTGKVDLLELVKKEAIKSPHGNTDIARIPSPGPGSNINSPLELGDQSTPLSDLLDVLLGYNTLELIIIFAILYILFNQILLNKLNNYIPAKYQFLKKISEVRVINNTKFMNILLISLIVLLLIFKFINLYVSYELVHNLNDYILVHNYIKTINKSSILLIMSNRILCTPLTMIFNIRHKFINYVLLNIYLLKFKFLNVINYLFYNLDGVVTMLYARGQFAWVKLITHQRLNVEHSSRAIFAELREINITKQMLNYYNELFYQWLVGVTDAEGTFQIVTKNGKWSLVFKLFQHESNKRLLYFIKKRLGVGAIKKSKTNHFYYKLTDNKKIKNHIFPIFDKYPLLTTKYFDYSKFKEAYTILEDINLTKIKQDELMFALLKKVPSKSYLSPAWKIVHNKVSDTNEAKKVISKAWLIGFTEAKGSFYFINSSKDKIVHNFKIIKILCPIVLYAIGRILGIKTNFKKSTNSIETTNSRAIQNIIKYFNGTMKGMKSFEYRVWARSYVKHKGDFTKLQEIKSKLKH